MESARMIKCKYKKSLFTCFKTVVDEDDDFKSPRRRNRNATIIIDPVLAYLVAADADGVVLFSTATMEECGNRRRKGGRDTWHCLKMALNETSLVRRIHSRRKTKKDSMSISNTNTTFDVARTSQLLNLNIIIKHKPTRRTTSNTSSNIAMNSSAIFLSSPSQSLTTSSNPDYVSINPPSHEVNIIPKPSPLRGTNEVSKKNIVEDNKRKRNITLCILWIFSLLVLVLWGKFFAILFTSIWFYIVPSRERRKCKKEVLLCIESDFDSLRYKKIIMEGILERSNSRASLLISTKS